MRLFIIIAFIVCSYMASGQVRTTPPTPTPPPTPATPQSSSVSTTVTTVNGKTYVTTNNGTTSGKSKSSSKVKVSSNGYHNSNSSSTSSSTSISIQNSDYTYTIRATFDENKTEKIRKLLMDNLEKDHFSSKGDSYIWKRMEDGETAYSFILVEGKLKGVVNKEMNSNSTVDRFVALGDKVSEALSD